MRSRLRCERTSCAPWFTERLADGDEHLRRLLRLLHIRQLSRQRILRNGPRFGHGGRRQRLLFARNQAFGQLRQLLQCHLSPAGVIAVGDELKMQVVQQVERVVRVFRHVAGPQQIVVRSRQTVQRVEQDYRATADGC